MKRRDFLKSSIVVLAGTSVPVAVLEWLDPAEVLASRPEIRWVMLVDTYKCAGCGFCVKGCKTENDIPMDANVTRTWVERYVVTHGGEVLADSPRGGRDGFTDPRLEVQGEERREIPEEEIAQAFFVPKLCNQCENPPCAQVCPVGATYATREGVVLVDRKWCIGCGYCVMGCPYGARFFHPVHKTADKCTFCIHRLEKGMKTACAEACAFGARRIGNLRDPKDPVAKVVLSRRVGVLKDEYGTRPQVYYLGLSKEVR